LRPSAPGPTLDVWTGRYRYEELESQEKSYIGTRIEIVVRTELELEPEGKLDTVIGRASAGARVLHRVPRQPVPREVIPTLAIQEDPMRRIRADRGGESLGGMKVLGGHYKIRRETAELLGYGPLTKRDYVSVPIVELDSLPAEMRRRL
jgi:hypothetical protein